MKSSLLPFGSKKYNSRPVKNPCFRWTGWSMGTWCSRDNSQAFSRVSLLTVKEWFTASSDWAATSWGFCVPRVRSGGRPLWNRSSGSFPNDLHVTVQKTRRRTLLILPGCSRVWTNE